MCSDHLRVNLSDETINLVKCDMLGEATSNIKRMMSLGEEAASRPLGKVSPPQCRGDSVDGRASNDLRVTGGSK